MLGILPEKEGIQASMQTKVSITLRELLTHKRAGTERKFAFYKSNRTHLKKNKNKKIY